MSESNWASLIIVINGLGMAFIGYLVVKVQAKVREVKAIVDGPLSVALKSNADLARKLANSSGRPEDVLAAEKAEAINRNRQEGKEE